MHDLPQRRVPDGRLDIRSDASTGLYVGYAHCLKAVKCRVEAAASKVLVWLEGVAVKSWLESGRFDSLHTRRTRSVNALS